MTIRAIDLFAGAGGWDVAAHNLGWIVHRAEVMPEANATAAAAGIPTVYGDVRDVQLRLGQYDALIASPPCQPFSIGGKGQGRADLDIIIRAVREQSWGWRAYLKTADPRAALVVEPMRLIRQCQPRLVALEQVPSVLPVWEAYAASMARWGYSTWTGVLNAEQYGVPQTRRRAILIARRDGQPVRPPAPTHSRHYLRDRARLDPGVLPWVSMADALGWGATGRPAPTVSGGGALTGGAEPFGHRARKSLALAHAAGNWRGEFRARPSLEDVAALQTFPAGYPFQGTAGKRFLQVGNAVPPLLARAILSTFAR